MSLYKFFIFRQLKNADSRKLKPHTKTSNKLYILKKIIIKVYVMNTKWLRFFKVKYHKKVALSVYLKNRTYDKLLYFNIDLGFCYISTEVSQEKSIFNYVRKINVGCESDQQL